MRTLALQSALKQLTRSSSLFPTQLALWIWGPHQSQIILRNYRTLFKKIIEFCLKRKKNQWHPMLKKDWFASHSEAGPYLCLRLLPVLQSVPVGSIAFPTSRFTDNTDPSMLLKPTSSCSKKKSTKLHVCSPSLLVSFLNRGSESGVAGHAYNPSTRKMEEGKLEVQAISDYTLSFKPAWATWDLVLKTKQAKKASPYVLV